MNDEQLLALMAALIYAGVAANPSEGDVDVRAVVKRARQLKAILEDDPEEDE